MSKSSKMPSKAFNILTTALEVLFQIGLLPFHIVKAIFSIIQELRQ